MWGSLELNFKYLLEPTTAVELENLVAALAFLQVCMYNSASLVLLQNFKIAGKLMALVVCIA